MEEVEALLKAVREGTVTPHEAAEALRTGHLPGGHHARLDFRRGERTGLPEIILGEGKSVPNLRDILRGLRKTGQGAVLSRLTDPQIRWLRGHPVPGLTWKRIARMATVPGSRPHEPLRGRTAAILTAGTVDVPVAEEARTVLEFMGAKVVVAYDVGVAGLHRLGVALEEIEQADAMVYVVCAGREGALPTVVAGLIDRPVVGVPTSSGYGRGAQGEAALTAMLQSCAPIAVVNIDGGVPAALVAAQILRGFPAKGPAGGAPRRKRRS